MTNFKAVLSGPEDMAMAWMISGILFDAGANPISLKDVEAFSTDLDQAKFAPEYINTRASFLAYMTAARVRGHMKSLGYQEIGSLKVKRVDQWSDLADAMRAKLISLEPPRQ